MVTTGLGTAGVSGEDFPFGDVNHLNSACLEGQLGGYKLEENVL